MRSCAEQNIACKQPHRLLTRICVHSRPEDKNPSSNAKSTAPSRPKPSKTFSRHPDFPNLPASVPLTYALTMTACLSDVPSERPTFLQLQQILSDLGDEVARGFYINGQGRAQVRGSKPPLPRPPSALHCCGVCVCCSTSGCATLCGVDCHICRPPRSGQPQSCGVATRVYTT